MRYLYVLFFVLLGGNGLFMLLAPQQWYLTIPGVVQTGPFNPHFVRDVGMAYLLCGVAFGALLKFGAGAKPYAVAGSVFILGHGLIHALETLADSTPLTHFLADLPLVVVLPAVAFWSVVRIPRGASHV